MTAYPSTLPSPLLDGFSASVAMGVIRADLPMHEAQRRVFTTMPHSFALTFKMSVIDWGIWYQWVSLNAYGWFTMNLPTMYAGLASQLVSPVLIRFTSDLSAANVTGSDVQITVAAEIAPSMISGYLGAI